MTSTEFWLSFTIVVLFLGFWLQSGMLKNFMNFHDVMIHELASHAAAERRKYEARITAALSHLAVVEREYAAVKKEHARQLREAYNFRMTEIIAEEQQP